MKLLNPRDFVAGAFAVLLFCMLLLGCHDRGKQKQAANECYANLMALGPACSSFLLDHEGKFVADLSTNVGGSKEFVAQPNAAFRHFQPIAKDWLAPHFLACPADNRRPTRTWNSLKNDRISYFLSLSFNPNEKSGLLAGDRNIARNGNNIFSLGPETTKGWQASTGLHGTNGWLLFMDGHAEFLDGAGLVKAITSQGAFRNQIAVP